MAARSVGSWICCRRLRVVNDLSAYPLPMLLDVGVLVTNNSDESPYFGGYLNVNYAAVSKSLSL